MVDISGISAALSSLIAAKDITQAMIGLHDAAALNGKIAELNSKIIDAQSGIFLVNEERSTLIERVSRLEKEVADFETWETEKQKYILKEVDSGAFAFVLKPEAQGTEPPHWLCTTCHGNRKKSFCKIKEALGQKVALTLGELSGNALLAIPKLEPLIIFHLAERNSERCPPKKRP